MSVAPCSPDIGLLFWSLSSWTFLNPRRAWFACGMATWKHSTFTTARGVGNTRWCENVPFTSVSEVWFLLFSCLIIILPQSHVRRMLPVWLYQTPHPVKAWFHDGEIMSAKYGWLYMSDSIEFCHRSEQNWLQPTLAKRNVFPRNLIYCHCPCTNLFQMFSHFAEKTRSWNKSSQTFRDGYIDDLQFAVKDLYSCMTFEELETERLLTRGNNQF